MRIPSSLVPPALLLSLLVACSSNDTDTPVTPQSTDTTHHTDTTIHKDSVKVYRTYDGDKKGVQITAIFFDQGLNKDLFGLNDEWIILESSGGASIKGWHLNAGDVGQDYLLPDTIPGWLAIYTHADPSPRSDSTYGLGLTSGKWIWNNSDPDIARLYDANGTLVSSMTY